MKRLMTILSAAVLLCACSADEQPSIPQEKEDSALVTFTIGIDPPEGSTKSSITVSSQVVSDINLLAYHEGKLAEVLYVQESQSISANMVKGRTYNFYALANVGRIDAPTDEEQIKSYQLSVTSATMTEGFPMVWSLSDKTIGQSGNNINITLRRLHARINLTVDLSDVSGLTITDARICQGAVKAYPFKDQSKATSSSDVADGDFASADDVATLNSGRSVTFYALENCQGVLLPDNTDPWLKVPEELSSGSELCTYLEITASYSGDYGGVEVQSERLKYRFFLGADNCTDFNIVRNKDINVSLCISEDNVFEHCWKVDFGEDLPVIEYGLECTPVSASVNVGKTTALKAVYFRTADGLRVWESDYTSYVSWSTSNSTVATVSKGTVTAKSPGTAVITASIGNSRAASTIEVIRSQKTLTGLTLETDRSDYYAGDYAYFTAWASFSDGTSDDVTELCSWDCYDDCLGTSTPGVFIAGNSDESGTFEIYCEYTFEGVTKYASLTFDVTYMSEGFTLSSTTAPWQKGSLSITISDPDNKGWSFTSDDDHFTMSGGASGKGNATRTLSFNTLYSGGTYKVYVHIGSKTYSATITRKAAPSNTYTVDYWCYARVTSTGNSSGDSGPGIAEVYFRLASPALQNMTIYDNHGNVYTIAKGAYESAKKSISMDYMPYDDLVPDFFYGKSISPSVVTTYSESEGIVKYSYVFDY